MAETWKVLFRDLVGALPAGVLRGLDRVAALAAQDAYEASNCVPLPTSRLHNLGERHTLRAPHHRDHLSLLVAALGRLFASRLAGRLLRGFGLLGRLPAFARGLRLRELTQDGVTAYVTNAASNSVSVINTATNTVAATISVGANPVNLATH